jgi:hypothetical protein
MTALRYRTIRFRTTPAIWGYELMSKCHMKEQMNEG